MTSLVTDDNMASSTGRPLERRSLGAGESDCDTKMIGNERKGSSKRTRERDTQLTKARNELKSNW